MRVSEARENIGKALALLNSLKNSTSENEAIPATQMELVKILDSFTPETLENLKHKLKKTRKKRVREALNRKERKQSREELLLVRQKRNEEVERLFRQRQEEEERRKAEESVRRQADVVLTTVTKHKLEGRRVLSLLSALSKLRAGRCQQDAAAGAMPSTAVTDAFETALGKLRGLWEKQLDGYAIEEAGLKVMLAEGSASRLGQAERELDSILHDWEKAMFGAEPAPEMSWQQIIQVRHEWDQYLVAPDMPLSSGIPPGWVLPQELSGEWEKHVSRWEGFEFDDKPSTSTSG